MATNRKSTAEKYATEKENKNMKKTQFINLLALALFAYLAIINLVKLGALISTYGIFGGILLELVFIALALFALYALNRDILLINCALDVLKSLAGRLFGDKESKKDSFVRDVKTTKKETNVVLDVVICKECGEPIPVGKRFCPECGNPAPVVEKLEEVVCECGEVIPAGKKFCPECGKAAPKPIPKEIICECGEVVPAGKKFCPECGKKVR